MKERPILFNGAMVRAILEGRKTQTRRVVKQHCIPIIEECFRVNGKWCNYTFDYDLVELCPHGQPGDRLVVKEAAWMWCRKERNGTSKTGRAKFRYIPLRGADIYYCADHLPAPDRPGSPSTDGEWAWRKKIGRFLPRWASRLTLEITEIRAQRLQEISNEDAIDEGMEMRLPTEEDLKWCEETYGNRDMHGVWIAPGTDAGYGPSTSREYWSTTAKGAFQFLWDSINAERDEGAFAWAKNPWVWAVTFKRIDQ